MINGDLDSLDYPELALTDSLVDSQEVIPEIRITHAVKNNYLSMLWSISHHIVLRFDTDKLSLALEKQGVTGKLLKTNRRYGRKEISFDTFLPVSNKD